MTRYAMVLVCALAVLAYGAPAAAQAQAVFTQRLVLTTGPVNVMSGPGAPEGVRVGSPPDIYVQTDSPYGHYRKISGTNTNTGWAIDPFWTTVTAKYALLGPISGSAALPTFRPIAVTDLPAGASNTVLTGPGPTYSANPTVTTLTTTSDANVGAKLTVGDRLTASLPYSVLTQIGGMFYQKASGTTYGTRLYADASGAVFWNAFSTAGSGSYIPIRIGASTVAMNGSLSVASTLTIGGTSAFSGFIGHPDFVSQTSKWRITPNGDADFRYVYVDELHAKSFTADLEQALAGGQIISKSVSPLAADFACPAKPGIGTIVVNDFPGFTGIRVFVSGDFVQTRTFNRTAGSLTIGNCVGVVTGYTDLGNGTQSWTFTRAAANSGSLSPGTITAAQTLALDFGTTGNGYYEVRADDGSDAVNSPYAQVVTWTGYPDNKTVNARFGKLTGITGNANEYGLIAGIYGGAGSSYFRASNLAFELYNIDLSLWSGANRTLYMNHLTPSFAMATSGADTLTFASGDGFWMGLDAGVFKFRIGSAGAHNFLSYNGTQVTLDGNIVVTGTSIDASSVLGVAGATVNSGAARGLLGLDGNGNPSLPHTATPSGSGLFIGSDYFGYFASGVWKTFLDSSGGFYLGGTLGSLRWDGTTLTIIGGGTFSGALSAATGTFAGSLSAATGTFAGSLSAATGTFAGNLSGAGGTFAGALSAATGTFAGALSAATGTFAGSLSAVTGSFSGTVTTSNITADGGVIAGWNINSTSLTDAAGVVGILSSSSGAGAWRFYAGSATPSIAPFRVDADGNLFAISGALGGFTIEAERLYAGSGGGSIELNTHGSSTPALSIGGGTFVVMMDGTFTATSATITGDINATSLTSTNGHIGGFTIGSNNLSVSGLTLGDVGGGVTGVSADTLVGRSAHLGDPGNGSVDVFVGGKMQFSDYSSGSLCVDSSGIVFTGCVSPQVLALAQEVSELRALVHSLLARH